MARYDAMKERFDEVTLLGRPALFTDLRIERSTVPEGYHLYEVRHGDECQFDAVQVARGIMVNHCGTLIMRDKLRLGADGYLDIDPQDLDLSGKGGCRSMDEFMQAYPPKTKKPKNKEHER